MSCNTQITLVFLLGISIAITVSSCSGFRKSLTKELRNSLILMAIYSTIVVGLILAIHFSSGTTNEKQKFIIALASIGILIIASCINVIFGMMIEIDLKSKRKAIFLFIASIIASVISLLLIKDQFSSAIIMGSASIFSSISLAILITIQIHIYQDKSLEDESNYLEALSERKLLEERSQKYYEIYKTKKGWH